MVINRHCGVRAARCCTEEDVELTRRHNSANVLVLGGRQIKLEEAISFLRIFLSTSFEGGRHQKRIEKMDVVV
jgi:ribose 5-phosphate isomerase B